MSYFLATLLEMGISPGITQVLRVWPYKGDTEVFEAKSRAHLQSLLCEVEQA